MNQMQGGGSKVMSFGKSRAKRMAVDSPKITFKDVAGADEAVEELHEIKEFLENPKKFQALGARIPKGVLLYGPPGTGKTLLARAVAGEAGVPFFSISGSDFVEMFVGVGASRVRDLFEQAKQNAPCIIFMDEIDAVGRHRGAGLGGGHDEREQTLNQLLVEMDGFELKDNIILIAATNRPDILDPALLRPGRFDRQIVVDRPGPRGPRARSSRCTPRASRSPRRSTSPRWPARRPGFTGADLANLVNEAALLAARHGRKTIGMNELEEGIMRVIAGPEKKTRAAVREGAPDHGLPRDGPRAGRALPARAATRCTRSRSSRRGQALGYTISMPTEDKFLTTRQQLRDQLAMTLGGRAAEELVFDEVTTGAANDLEKVTAHGQEHDHALRHEREARPAHARPQPRPAVPRPRVLAGARLLRGDRARDRRRDPPHRRGGARARPHACSPSTTRRCTGSPRSWSSARRSTATSSCACSTARPRSASSPRPEGRRRPTRRAAAGGAEAARGLLPLPGALAKPPEPDPGAARSAAPDAAEAALGAGGSRASRSASRGRRSWASST